MEVGFPSSLRPVSKFQIASCPLTDLLSYGSFSEPCLLFDVELTLSGFPLSKAGVTVIVPRWKTGSQLRHVAVAQQQGSAHPMT